MENREPAPPKATPKKHKESLVIFIPSFVRPPLKSDNQLCAPFRLEKTPERIRGDSKSGHAISAV
jgi:hypothetical protein